MIFQFVRRVSSADRAQKRLILVAYDVVAMMVALWAAFSARLGEPYLPVDPLVLAGRRRSRCVVGLVGLFQLRIYHIVLRFFDLGTVSRILFGAAIAATAWVILVYFMRASMMVDGIRILVPRSVGFIYGGFLFVLLFMGRYAMAALVIGAERKHPDRPRRAPQHRHLRRQFGRHQPRRIGAPRPPFPPLRLRRRRSARCTARSSPAPRSTRPKALADLVQRQ